jgi:hypothetical protein
MKEKKSANRVLLGTLNICFMIILKGILEEQDEVWTEFIHLKIGTRSGLL